MKRLFAALLAAGFLTGPALSLEGASDKPKRGGTLTVGLQRDLTVMNPLVRTRSTERYIRELMFEPLLGLDLKGNLQPNLAESWTASGDGRLYIFNLRRGVKFHNGQEMTAEDAKFAIDYSLNPKNSAYGYQALTIIDRVEAADRYSLRIHLKRATPAFIFSLVEIGTFSIVPKGSLQDGVDKPPKFPPGTGPFKFVEWQPQQRAVFERHEDYWGHKAFVDRLVLRPIANATVRFSALRAGDVDLVERTPYEWVKQIVEGKLKGIGFAAAPYAGYRRLVFNVPATPFNNKKLRQAVAHAIDKREILHAAYFGFGEPADQSYPNGHAWYIDGVLTPSHNLEKARALLKESGYKGEVIEIVTQQGEEVEPTTLQAQLKRIGINLQVKILEYGAYTALQRRGEFTFDFMGGGDYVDASGAYGANLMCEVDLKKRAANDSGYCDKELEGLIKRAETEMDAAKRRDLFKQILTKLAEDVPELPVGFVPRFFAFADHVKGFTTDGKGALRPWGAGVNYVWLDK
jgi:peptide/nickel transport system substrate-binding protein